MRISDSRLGRFLSVDPLQAKYPELTVYQFASNSPIANIDLDGLEKYHYTLTYDAQGKTKLVFSSVEHFTVTKKTWTPTWSDWSKTTTTTTRDPFVKCIVHGSGSYLYGLDGTLGENSRNLTWTFDNHAEMLTAQSRGGVGKDASWWWGGSDQSISIGVEIGLMNGIQAEMENGGSRGSWRKGPSSPEAAMNKQAAAISEGNPGASKANTAGQTAPTVTLRTASSTEIQGFITTEPSAQGTKALSDIQNKLNTKDLNLWAKPIFTTTYNNKTYVLDGNHRLTVVAKDKNSTHVTLQELSTSEATKRFPDKMKDIKAGNFDTKLKDND